MSQVVYLPDSDITIERFIVISKLDDLLEYIKYNRVNFLSIPVNGDLYDIIDTIVSNKISVKTIHIQEHNNLIKKLKGFFFIAKVYLENDIKKDVILKHEYLDNILKENKKKD